MSNSTIQQVPDLKYGKFRLSNGLDVILLEDHRLPLVAVNIWYHVGPANERPGLTGFAHLFEHMMFEGSKHVGARAHFRYLEAAGASEVNGTTDFDRTNYFETLPSSQLELALWLESDRMGYLLDELDEAKLENQRDVVRNERRQSVESSPYGLVQEAVFHELFPKDHPYYSSVIGSHADIEAARLDDVRDFFRKYYAPNNASLAVVGDIDPERTRKLVEKYFGPIPAGPTVPKVGVKTPRITSERRTVVTDQVELPRVYMAWITEPIFTAEDADCDLLGKILGGGKSSRLYRSLVYERRIAQDAIAQQYSLSLGSVFNVEVTAKPGIQPEELEKAVDEEIEKLAADGPEPAEVEGALNTIETAIIRGLENLGGFGGVADRLNMYNHYLEDPGYLARDIERYRRVSVESLKQAAKKKLARSSRVVVYGVPGPKVVHDVPKSSPATGKAPAPSSPSPEQAWRKQTPPPGPASNLKLPVPEKLRLDNGLAVFYVGRHDLPIVSVNFIVLSGSGENPPELPGLASFTAEMLDEGTAKRSALDIAADVDQLGASVSTSSSMDFSYVAFRALKKNTEGAFELASDLLLNSEFPQREVDRLRNDRLTQILQQRDNPNTIATRQFFRSVYGTGHPYGHMEIGTEESNQAITRDQLVRFWRKGYLPHASALIVAGDLSQSELLSLAEKYLSGWKGRSKPAEVPPIDTPGGRRVVIVDKPGSPQTALRIGHAGIARHHPDFVPVSVMNACLGGLFSSRINLNLREEHGYTYGASSIFLYRRGPGPFLIGTGVRTDVTADAVKQIFYEVERMRTTEPAPEELAMAKDSISRSLPGLFETTPQAASSIGLLFVYDLEIDYYRHLPGLIDGVSGRDIEEVSERHLKPEEMVVVAVGDAATIGPELEKLELGPVERYDLDGKRIG